MFGLASRISRPIPLFTFTFDLHLDFSAVAVDADGGLLGGEVVVVVGVDAEGDLHGVGRRGIEGERQPDVTAIVRGERDDDAGFGVGEVAWGRRRQRVDARRGGQDGCEDSRTQ